jgi:hypothetical protein
MSEPGFLGKEGQAVARHSLEAGRQAVMVRLALTPLSISTATT